MANRKKPDTTILPNPSVPKSTAKKAEQAVKKVAARKKADTPPATPPAESPAQETAPVAEQPTQYAMASPVLDMTNPVPALREVLKQVRMNQTVEADPNAAEADTYIQHAIRCLKKQFGDSEPA